MFGGVSAFGQPSGGVRPVARPRGAGEGRALEGEPQREREADAPQEGPRAPANSRVPGG